MATKTEIVAMVGGDSWANRTRAVFGLAGVVGLMLLVSHWLGVDPDEMAICGWRGLVWSASHWELWALVGCIGLMAAGDAKSTMRSVASVVATAGGVILFGCSLLRAAFISGGAAATVATAVILVLGGAVATTVCSGP